MEDDIGKVSEYAGFIAGKQSLPENCGIIIKRNAYVVREKGNESVEGGEWVPSKPEDERFLGEPGNINFSRSSGKRGGYDRETKIGNDGKAVKERHHIDHDNPSNHSDPHDHEIDWSNGYPKPGPQINYPDGSVPEFKYFKEMRHMSKLIGQNSLEDNRFKTISDFKWCMKCGGEVEFAYNDRVFGIFPLQKRLPESEYQILIIEKFVVNQEETGKWYNTPDDALEYLIDDVRLRDIITEVEVTDRTV